MKNRFLIVVGIIALAAGALIITTWGGRRGKPSPGSTQSSTPGRISKASSASHTRVPAYQLPSETRNLGPTLAPAQFIGKTREAYRAAKEIPQTLAQLPCYCHCDQSLEHKSLHSCFEDDHASQCAVCTDEALLAYRLEKHQGLTPEQVRKIIIQKYSAEN
ncbi:MAG: CYCXC family (seleno)protein [Pyrinomonadaceae bacterium]